MSDLSAVVRPRAVLTWRLCPCAPAITGGAWLRAEAAEEVGDDGSTSFAQFGEQDGWDFERRIRRETDDLARQGGHARCLAAGSDGYFSKPARGDVLRATLERCCAGPNAADQST